MNSIDGVSLAKPSLTEPPVSEDRKRVGKFLYRAAWVIEVFAILIGLGIAVMTMVSSFVEMQTYKTDGLGLGGYTNIFIATLPFVMVAVVEGTKIPFVEAYYKTTSKLWKWVFGLSLIFITFITFESAFNGFERNFNALMYSIDTEKKNLIGIDEKIELLNQQKTELDSLTIEKIEADYNSRYEALNEQTGEQRSGINVRINDLRATITDQYVLSRQQFVKQRQEDKAALVKQRNGEVEAARKRYEADSGQTQTNFTTKQRSLQAQLAREEGKLEAVIYAENEKIKGAIWITRSRVEQERDEAIDKQTKRVDRIRDQINALDPSLDSDKLSRRFSENRARILSSYNTRITEIERDIAKVQDEIANSIGIKTKEVEKQVEANQSELREVEAFFKEQLSKIQQKRDEDLDKLSNNEERATEMQQQLDDFSEQRVVLRDFINKKVGNNQIYRMAQWWTEKESAADVSRGEVAFIAIVWFGSLAILIACTGILLAAASLVITDPSYYSRYEKKRGFVEKTGLAKLLYSIRSAVISIRKKFRTSIVRIETVEVPKEITVEKAVLQEVVKEVPVNKVVVSEVPVEVIKKEVIHVPFYTNDKDLLNLSSDSLIEKNFK